MKIRLNNQGVGHMVMLGLVLVVAVVGFAGYYVMSANNNATKENSADVASDNNANGIRTQADLEQAGAELDTAAAQLDKDLDTSVLDSDMLTEVRTMVIRACRQVKKIVCLTMIQPPTRLKATMVSTNMDHPSKRSSMVCWL